MKCWSCLLKMCSVGQSVLSKHKDVLRSTKCHGNHCHQSYIVVHTQTSPPPFPSLSFLSSAFYSSATSSTPFNQLRSCVCFTATYVTGLYPVYYLLSCLMFLQCTQCTIFIFMSAKIEITVIVPFVVKFVLHCIVFESGINNVILQCSLLTLLLYAS